MDSAHLGFAKVRTLYPIIELAKARNLPLGSIIDRSYLPTNLEDEPDAVIACASVHRLLMEISDALGEEDVGWQAGTVYHAAENGGGSATDFSGLQDSGTLLDAALFADREGRRRCSSRRVFVVSSGEFAYLCHHSGPDEKLPGIEHRTLCRTGIMIQHLRKYLGPAWVPDVVGLHFDLSKAPVGGEAIRWVRCLGPNYIRFPREALDLRCRVPVVASSHETGSAALGLIDGVRQLLLSYSHERLPELDVVAELTGVSRRTLQRKLRDAGYSFRQLTSEVKFRTAADLLTVEGMSVREVAGMLGFADATQFSRFFSRYAGIPPTTYRRVRAQPAESIL